MGLKIVDNIISGNFYQFIRFIIGKLVRLFRNSVGMQGISSYVSVFFFFFCASMIKKGNIVELPNDLSQKGKKEACCFVQGTSAALMWLAAVISCISFWRCSLRAGQRL